MMILKNKLRIGALFKTIKKNFTVNVQKSGLVPKEEDRVPSLLVEMEDEFVDDEIEKEFMEINRQSQMQLKDMNEALIEDIIKNGGVEGWNIAPDLSEMRKQYSFESFEQAMNFCSTIGKFCSMKDHHPEWKVIGDGKVVDVKLTSHFAGKVTVNDFELAQAMNKNFYIVKEMFNLYKPKVDRSELWVAFMLLGAVFGTIAVYNKWSKGVYRTNEHLLTQDQRFVRIPSVNTTLYEKDLYEFLADGVADDVHFRETVNHINELPATRRILRLF